jgi:hypothetical protein
MYNLHPDKQYNYVETAHSSDMNEFKQEYGGFSLLDESEKQEIVKMVFGEDWKRWDKKGLTEDEGHDYNMYWPPEQVMEFVKLMPEKLDAAGVGDVGITPGEPSNGYRFSTWGYVEAFLQDKEALESLGLITSHGYYSGNYGRWSGNIYTAKVNAIIPWAGIQRPPHWVGGDPNPGSAFTDSEDGTYKVRPGYYFYKQITRAGQPGMKVAEASAMDSETAVIAFASNSTLNPDAFIVTNINTSDQKIAVTVLGTQATSFEAYSTTKAPGSGLDETQENYKALGTFEAPA